MRACYRRDLGPYFPAKIDPAVAEVRNKGDLVSSNQRGQCPEHEFRQVFRPLDRAAALRLAKRQKRHALSFACMEPHLEPVVEETRLAGLDGDRRPGHAAAFPPDDETLPPPLCPAAAQRARLPLAGLKPRAETLDLRQSWPMRCSPHPGEEPRQQAHSEFFRRAEKMAHIDDRMPFVLKADAAVLKLIRRLLESLTCAAHPLRCHRQMLEAHPCPVEHVLHLANPHPLEHGIFIARIVEERLPLCLEESSELRPANPKQGPQHSYAVKNRLARHGAQAIDAGAARKAHEKSLRLIIERMAGNHALCVILRAPLCEQPIARLSCPRLQRPRRLLLAPCEQSCLEAEPPRPSRHLLRLAPGILSQSMVERQHGEFHRPLPPRCQLHQPDRVRPARDSQCQMSEVPEG